MSATYSERGSNAAERLLETAKRNPEGALLVAAGVCLMMRGIGKKNGSGFWRSAPRSSYRPPAGYSGGNGNLHEDDQSRGMMDTMRETASDMSGRVRESAEGIAGRVRQSAEEVAGYADHMRRAAADTSGRIIGRTTSTVQGGVERMMDEQPLALAVLGLAAGAAVAALVPPTRMEERTLGPIGERITEEAEEAGRRVKEAATEAGKRLANEGLSEARNVARSLASEADRDGKSGSTASGSMGSAGMSTGQGASAGMPGAGGAESRRTSASDVSGSGTVPGSAGSVHEKGIGKSAKEPGSSGPGSSGTGRVG